jgi:hypothetical protein
MNKKMCVAGKIHKGDGTITDDFGCRVKVKTWLPDGCLGTMFAFESKKAAKAYYKGLKDENIILIKRINEK